MGGEWKRLAFPVPFLFLQDQYFSSLTISLWYTMIHSDMITMSVYKGHNSSLFIWLSPRSYASLQLPFPAQLTSKPFSLQLMLWTTMSQTCTQYFDTYCCLYFSGSDFVCGLSMASSPYFPFHTFFYVSSPLLSSPQICSSSRSSVGTWCLFLSLQLVESLWWSPSPSDVKVWINDDFTCPSSGLNWFCMWCIELNRSGSCHDFSGLEALPYSKYFKYPFSVLFWYTVI